MLRRINLAAIGAAVLMAAGAAAAQGMAWWRAALGRGKA